MSKITAALIYDFDGTLSPDNIQEHAFIKAVGDKNKILEKLYYASSPSFAFLDDWIENL